MSAISKKELVDIIAAKSGLAKSEAAKNVDVVLDAITDSLRENVSIRLMGFGNFEVKGRAARTGRNPKTGESIQVPAKTVVSFKPAKSLI